MTTIGAEVQKVDTPSDVQKGMVEKAEAVRALAGGTDAMRKAGTKYLPQEKAESADAYAARISRSWLFNALGKTVADMTGKVFAKEITFGDDVPADIKAMAENIDLTGRHLNVFARDVFADGMKSGIGYIFVDMPPAVKGNDGKAATIAQEQAAGIRPYLTYIRLENLIGWKSTVQAGAEVLTQIRIRECVTEADGEFHEKEVEQIRVVEPGKWRTYRKSADTTKSDVWILYDQGDISLTGKIALVPVYINRTNFMCGEPPLQKIAELNIAHWQSSSDQRNILHVARVPILFGAGFDAETEIEVGASRMIRTTNENATLEYVEHTGAAIEAGQKDIEKLEQQMQTMGLQLLVDKPGEKTATGEVRADVKENSPLAMMARALQDALEQAFGFIAEFRGQGADKGGSIVVNTDFGIQAGGGTDLQDLQSARSSGDLSRETLWDEMQRRGTLSTAFDPEIEKERLASEPPPLDAGPGRGMDLNAPAPKPPA